MEIIKDTIQAGDTLTATVSRTAYPASEWVLTVYLSNATSAYSFEASTDGDNHLIEVSATSTGSWAPGLYQYAVTVFNDDGDTYTIERGSTTILSSLGSVSETRSLVKQTLDALEATLLGRATQDQLRYSIAGRSIDKIPVPDLLKLRDQFKAEYNQELQAEKIAKGLSTNNRILVRFNEII
jgi:hypothetical protein